MKPFYQHWYNLSFRYINKKNSGIIMMFLSLLDQINPDPQQSLPIYIIICIEITIINDGRWSRYGYIYLSKRISKIGQNILVINPPNRTPKHFLSKNMILIWNQRYLKLFHKCYTSKYFASVYYLNISGIIPSCIKGQNLQWAKDEILHLWK